MVSRECQAGDQHQGDVLVDNRDPDAEVPAHREEVSSEYNAAVVDARADSEQEGML